MKIKQYTMKIYIAQHGESQANLHLMISKRGLPDGLTKNNDVNRRKSTKLLSEGRFQGCAISVLHGWGDGNPLGS